MRLALALMLAAGPAVALTPRDCATPDLADALRPPPLPHEVFIRDLRGPAVDLGAGWALQAYEFTSDYGTQSGSKVVACGSGRALIVVEGAIDPTGKVLLTAGKRAEPVFRQAISASEAIPLSAVIAELESAGARVGEDMAQAATLESCACAVFYPDLRGDKTPWTEWSRQ